MNATAMNFITPINASSAGSLAMALIGTSEAPLLLLDGDLTIIGASDSFCENFQLDCIGIAGRHLADLGGGEWDVPQLDVLLRATARGTAAIHAYEMDLLRDGRKPRCLVLNAHRLDYDGADAVRIVLAVTDVTATRLAAQRKDDLVREKQILLQELQHRVANSLQIIASVLMQSARKVQSEETRTHLHDAHHRVMSIATLQRQLAVSRIGDVALAAYLTDLCKSIDASMISDHNRLSLTVTADDSFVPTEVSVSLGLIVTELVINALKHAFPGRNRVGAISVDYASQGTGWTLTVADNGVGMPRGEADAKPGLGTGIVDALSKQLDARVTIADAAPGTRVTIVHA